MGIPGFLSHIFNNYKKSIKEIYNCKTLLIDGNCIHHIALEKLAHKLNPSVDDLKLEIKRTYEYYLRLFNFEKCVICLDGRASESKKVCQKERRENTSKVMSIELIPGTQLSTLINDSLKETFLKDDKFVLDDTSNPGEGEHKIFKYITTNNFTSTIIITSDSDLIILSLLKTSACYVYYLSRKLSVDIDILKGIFLKKGIYNSLFEIVIACGNDYLPKSLIKLSIKDIEKIFKSKKKNTEFDIDIYLKSLMIYDHKEQCNRCDIEYIKSYFYQMKWFIACYTNLELNNKGIVFQKDLGSPCIKCMVANRKLFDETELLPIDIKGNDVEYSLQVLPSDLADYKEKYC